MREQQVDLERDAALVEQFQAGDEDAFVELFGSYFARLTNYCARRLGNRHQGEEVAQEAFARALVALPRLTGDRRFYPWICVIASNLCADVRHASARECSALAEDQGEFDARLEALVDGVDGALLRAAMTKLSERHRTALELWAEGVSSKQIAARLGCTAGTADVTVHRARARLRERYLVLSGERSRWVLVPGVAAASRWALRIRGCLSRHAANVGEFCNPLVAKAAAALVAVAATNGIAAAPAYVLSSGSHPAQLAAASSMPLNTPSRSATRPPPTATSGPVTARRLDPSAPPTAHAATHTVVLDAAPAGIPVEVARDKGDDHKPLVCEWGLVNACVARPPGYPGHIVPTLP